MSYYLGFDGGGTKTDCVVIDAAGRVLGEGSAGPSNPLRVGYDSAFAAMTEAAGKALSVAHLEKNALRGVCAALAGAGRPGVAQRVNDFLHGAFVDAATSVVSDFEAALEAAAGSGPGVVLIAGTGSAAFGRNAAGQTARAGGCGPWIGDEGSAFDIGRRAIAQLARARDRGEAGGRLIEQMMSAIHCADWDELVERVAAHADEVFPRVYPAVVEAAEAGDAFARELLRSAADSLFDLARTVIERLGLKAQPFVLAKAGGVFGRSRFVDDRLDALLGSLAPKARADQLRVSPAAGAAQLARRLAENAHT